MSSNVTASPWLTPGSMLKKPLGMMGLSWDVEVQLRARNLAMYLWTIWVSTGRTAATGLSFHICKASELAHNLLENS